MGNGCGSIGNVSDDSKTEKLPQKVRNKEKTIKPSKEIEHKNENEKKSIKDQYKTKIFSSKDEIEEEVKNKIVEVTEDVEEEIIHEKLENIAIEKGEEEKDQPRMTIDGVEYKEDKIHIYFDHPLDQKYFFNNQEDLVTVVPETNERGALSITENQLIVRPGSSALGRTTIILSAGLRSECGEFKLGTVVYRSVRWKVTPILEIDEENNVLQTCNLKTLNIRIFELEKSCKDDYYGQYHMVYSESMSGKWIIEDKIEIEDPRKMNAFELSTKYELPRDQLLLIQVDSGCTFLQKWIGGESPQKSDKFDIKNRFGTICTPHFIHSSPKPIVQIFIGTTGTKIGEMMKTHNDPQIFINSDHQNCTIQTEETGGNYAKGFFGIDINSKFDEEIRKIREQKEIQGFHFIHSSSGGLGSSVSLKLMDSIKEKSSGDICFSTVVLPFGEVTSDIYNTIFCLAGVYDEYRCNLAYIYENDSNLSSSSSWEDINRKYEQGMRISRFSGISSSSFNLKKHLMNYIPYPKIHFLVQSLSNDFSSSLDSRSLLSGCRFEDGRSIVSEFVGLVGKNKFDHLEMIGKEVNFKFSSKFNTSDYSSSNFKSRVHVLEEEESIYSVISNSSSVVGVVERWCSLFDQNYSKRNGVHSYLGFGLEEGEFSMAREDLQDFIYGYKEVVMDTIEEEEEDDDE